MSDPTPITWLTRPDGLRLATRRDAAREPGAALDVVFLHGLMSDMQGEKARHLRDHAVARGIAITRLDLSGHGRSEGAFEACTVSQWRDDALLALDQPGAARSILVGSSIGGWIALLAALARPRRVAGLLLIAPAPDMTRRVREALPPPAREALRRHGVWLRPSRYGAAIPITARMLEDGERLCLLDGPIALSCPVRILHGQMDPDVPWQDSLRLAARLQSRDVQTILLKHGDHRLSSPRQLALLTETLDALLHDASGDDASGGGASGADAGRADAGQAEAAASAARIAASPSR